MDRAACWTHISYRNDRTGATAAIGCGLWISSTKPDPGTEWPRQKLRDKEALIPAGSAAWAQRTFGYADTGKRRPERDSLRGWHFQMAPFPARRGNQLTVSH